MDTENSKEDRPITMQATAAGYSPHYLAAQLSDLAATFAEGGTKSLLHDAANRLRKNDSDIGHLGASLEDVREQLAHSNAKIKLANLALNSVCVR